MGPGYGDPWGAHQRWVDQLQRLCSDRHAFNPQPGSQLAADDVGMPAFVSVTAVSRAMLDSALDALATAVSTVAGTGVVHPVGFPTLVRGSIELAGVGSWVLAGTAAAARRGRALRIEVESSGNAVTFFEEIAESTATPDGARQEVSAGAEHYAHRRQEAEDAAAALGISKRSATDRVVRTRLLRELDDEKGTRLLTNWRLCSGFAHGFAWAPDFFAARQYAHAAEGGGTLIGGHLPEERALAMVGWGRDAIASLVSDLTAAAVPSEQQT